MALNQNDDIDFIRLHLKEMSETNKRLQRYKNALEQQQQEFFLELQTYDEEIYEKSQQNKETTLISKTKMIEIKAYTANELFRAKRRTDSLYSEFSQVK